MKNLVSRNPVQRFKEGKKIIFAETGIKTSAPTRGTKFGDWMRKQTSKGFVWQNSKDNSIIQPGQEILVGGQYLKGNGTYTSASLRNKKNENVTGTSSKTNNFDKIRQSANDYADKLLKSNTAKVSTPVSSPGRIQKNWNNEFTNNFTNTLTQAQRQYLDSKGINYTNASDVQKFLMDQLQTDLGGYKNDGKWGKNSIQAWKDFASNSIPENFSVIQEQKNMNIGTKPYTPVANFGYRTSNTYEDNDFSDRLKNMGIRSNADLIDFMHKTNGENYNWNGDNWARQFRSDVNQALGGDYSDANIRKVFNTAGNWHKGFLGRGDLGDFQNVLQTRAGAWNGEYDRNLNNYIKNGLGNYVKNIDWTKFKLFKQGGSLLPSKNIVTRFKNRNFRLVVQ